MFFISSLKELGIFSKASSVGAKIVELTVLLIMDRKRGFFSRMLIKVLCLPVVSSFFIRLLLYKLLISILKTNFGIKYLIYLRTTLIQEKNYRYTKI